MNEQKLRIRFRKTGDLRWISHRDLARTFERLLRRVDVPLAMSQGFHPHPKINFPSALSVGIEGQGEWVEVSLCGDVPDDISQQLTHQAPPGLEIIEANSLDRSHPKPVVASTDFEIAVPDDRQQEAQTAIEALLGEPEYWITREKNNQTIDLRATLIDIQLEDGRLRFSLRATRTAQARPRDILSAIGLEDLEQLGQVLARTDVHLHETTQ